MNRPTRLFALCPWRPVVIGGSEDSTFEDPPSNAEITDTSGDLKISGPLSKPPARGPFPLVLIHHGDGMTARSMAWFADRFTAKGLVTPASDFRGRGIALPGPIWRMADPLNCVLAPACEDLPAEATRAY